MKEKVKLRELFINQSGNVIRAASSRGFLSNRETTLLFGKQKIFKSASYTDCCFRKWLLLCHLMESIAQLTAKSFQIIFETIRKEILVSTVTLERQSWLQINENFN